LLASVLHRSAQGDKRLYFQAISILKTALIRSVQAFVSLPQKNSSQLFINRSQCWFSLKLQEEILFALLEKFNCDW
jgi:hypothetical protein